MQCMLALNGFDYTIIIIIMNKNIMKLTITSGVTVDAKATWINTIQTWHIGCSVTLNATKIR